MNFDLMIVLATNKSIMRSKLKTALLGNLYLMIEVSTSWSILLDKFDLMNKHNFDLMIKNLISWKSWISISWNLTSWSFPFNRSKTSTISVNIYVDFFFRNPSLTDLKRRLFESTFPLNYGQLSKNKFILNRSKASTIGIGAGSSFNESPLKVVSLITDGIVCFGGRPLPYRFPAGMNCFFWVNKL